MGVLDTDLLESVADNVFEGNVFRTKVDDLERMFLSNIENFSESGIASFFKTCKIPSPAFFLEKPIEYVKETFLNQKSKLRDKGDILLLVRGDNIVYATMDTKVLQEDPTVKFDLDGWQMQGEDLMKGFRRYVYAPAGRELVKDSFTSTTFMNVPLLYNGKMTMEVGLYRVLCSNGMVTHIDDSDQLKIPQKTYESHLLFEPFLAGIISGLMGSADAYTDFLNYLTNKEVPELAILKDRLQILTEDKVISKQVAVFATRHLDLLEDNQPVTDETYPDTMNTMMDFTNLLTRFAQESKTISQQVKIEKQVFDYMYNQYREECKKEIIPLNLELLFDNLTAKKDGLLHEQGESV